MNPSSILSELNDSTRIADAMVLIRELKVFLRFDEHPHFLPEIKIRVYLSSTPPDAPYVYELSHHVHSPVQSAPYQTSAPWAATESEAIRQAVRGLWMYVDGAINAGHVPVADWLVRNPDF